ncbi:MAG: HAD-IIIA family hydrolase [Lachnospiraceae bacterium]|nr:HAD-IIIA family hydrolase [Lachnospiraceae bacterium]
MELKKQKILFLDRDGTICYDDGAFGSEQLPYDEVLKKLRPIEGVAESLKSAKAKGYMLVVISNQAGIAKGRFGECDTHYGNKLLQEKFDGVIDGFYYCPHHTSGKNNRGIIADNAKMNLIFNCDCRKPNIGMFTRCEEDLKNGKLQYIDERIINNKIEYEADRDSIFKKEVTPVIVDKENSYMIGDKWLDVLAGERYGVNAVFVMSGEGEVEYKYKKDKQKELPKNYKVYNDINEFIKELK